MHTRLLLPLVALLGLVSCAVTETAAEDAGQPEVRYYMIADT